MRREAVRGDRLLVRRAGGPDAGSAGMSSGLSRVRPLADPAVSGRRVSTETALTAPASRAGEPRAAGPAGRSVWRDLPRDSRASRPAVTARCQQSRGRARAAGSPVTGAAPSPGSWCSRAASASSQAGSFRAGASAHGASFGKAPPPAVSHTTGRGEGGTAVSVRTALAEAPRAEAPNRPSKERIKMRTRPPPEGGSRVTRQHLGATSWACSVRGSQGDHVVLGAGRAPC